MLALALALAPYASPAQSPRLQFDVASVKAYPVGVGPWHPRDWTGPFLPGGHFLDPRDSVKDLIYLAFGGAFGGAQFLGLPDWASRRAFSVEGRGAQAGPVGREQNEARQRLMLLSLLQGRFGLKYHTERRLMQACILTVARRGPRLKSAAPDEPRSSNMGFGRGDIVMLMRHVSAQDLAATVSFWAQEPALDRTGLGGYYDIDLDAPIPEPEPPHSLGARMADIKAVFAKYLGLRITREKAEVPVVVVDHLALPTPN